MSSRVPHLFNGEGFDIARDWRTMRESLARLRQERDELCARVAEFERIGNNILYCVETDMDALLAATAELRRVLKELRK